MDILRTVLLIGTKRFFFGTSTLFAGASRSFLALLAAGHAGGPFYLTTHVEVPTKLRGCRRAALEDSSTA